MIPEPQMPSAAGLADRVDVDVVVDGGAIDGAERAAHAVTDLARPRAPGRRAPSTPRGGRASRAAPRRWSRCRRRCGSRRCRRCAWRARRRPRRRRRTRPRGAGDTRAPPAPPSGRARARTGSARGASPAHTERGRRARDRCRAGCGACTCCRRRRPCRSTSRARRTRGRSARCAGSGGRRIRVWSLRRLPGLNCAKAMRDMRSPPKHAPADSGSRPTRAARPTRARPAWSRRSSCRCRSRGRTS